MDHFDDKWQRRQERWAQKQERWARRQEKWANHHHHHGGHGIFLGAIIVTIGTMLLLDNVGVIRFRDYWQYWPVILIVFGIVRIADSHGPAAIIWGSVLAGIGGLLLLDNLNLIYFDWRIFWPVILIAWGLMMVFRPRRWRGPRGPDVIGGPGGVGGPDIPQATDAGKLGLWTVFGGGRRMIDSQDFRGGEVTAIFGGYELDLTRAAIAGDSAVIDVNAVFGGVEIRVPETWTVEARGMGVFGGFGDETRPPRPDQVTRPQRLIVTGYATFGGVGIKN
jgi:predicted membrane protein